jgi:hypothetical protein
MRFKPPTMLRRHKIRSLIATGAVLAAAGGTVLAQSSPALADPQVTLVAVGSNTTQDVWNAFTNGTIAGTIAGTGTTVAATPAALLPGLVGSYNAVNPVTGTANEPITPTDGWAVKNSIVPNPTAPNPLLPGTCSFARPNGSSQGVAALRDAIAGVGAPNTTKVASPAPGLGCVDIARSSSPARCSSTASTSITPARWRAIRRPAAAAVHRPLAGGQAAGAADGRAVLRA